MPTPTFEIPNAEWSDQWRGVLGFRKYEINWRGEVREVASKRFIEPVTSENIFVRLENGHGKLITKRVERIRNDAFQREMQEMSRRRHNYTQLFGAPRP